MIPGYQKFMLPILEVLKDGKEYRLNEVRDEIAKKLSISNQARMQMLPSGKQSVYNNRLSWAINYLKKANLVESPKKAVLKITKQGKKVLQENPQEINLQFLMRFKSFRMFMKKDTNENNEKINESTTPEEMLTENYELIRKQLIEEILEQLMKCSPAAFEQLVVDLLLAMGYGGTGVDAGKAIGGSGDGGIDGVIKEDRLGLRQIYIQAKRWEKPVGHPEILNFSGALLTKNADRGVFITTSRFTSNAIRGAEKANQNIVLIDGEQLAELMIDYNVGVVETKKFVIKRLDLDYFDQFGN
jgi:restriction system protein